MGTPFKMSGPSLYSSPTKSIAKIGLRVAKKVVKFAKNTYQKSQGTYVDDALKERTGYARKKDLQNAINNRKSSTGSN
tara:strand:+ start:25 stop:258 length:234 start_codon:yes stop_codon:yes gene_type:complete